MSDGNWNRTLVRNDDVDVERPLADRLRATLQAARGNVQIRARLARMIAETDRLDEIVEELGPRHALVRELLTIAQHAESGPG